MPIRARPPALQVRDRWLLEFVRGWCARLNVATVGARWTQRKLLRAIVARAAREYGGRAP